MTTQKNAHHDIKTQESPSEIFLESEEREVIIFTDGSSRGNPGPGGWGTIVMYPDSQGFMFVDELGGGEDHTTNNRMEITAAVEGLQYLEDFYDKTVSLKIIFYTDSSYLIHGATKWIHGWKRNNWISSTKEDVKNRDLWEALDELMLGSKIEWRKIKGHAGVHGNERCDEIATTYADKKEPVLYRGPLASYALPELAEILNTSVSHSLNTSGSDKPRSSSKGSPKGKKAYSYVSSVDGNILAHKTWAECEGRVKGKSGARYKKSFSKEGEEEIIKEFSKK